MNKELIKLIKTDYIFNDYLDDPKPKNDDEWLKRYCKYLYYTESAFIKGTNIYRIFNDYFIEFNINMADFVDDIRLLEIDDILKLLNQQIKELQELKKELI